jgi:hypothetical protein
MLTALGIGRAFPNIIQLRRANFSANTAYAFVAFVIGASLIGAAYNIMDVLR